eukprot:366490-Chlamydomonas_euryale.AAC.24
MTRALCGTPPRTWAHSKNLDRTAAATAPLLSGLEPIAGSVTLGQRSYPKQSRQHCHDRFRRDSFGK